MLDNNEQLACELFMTAASGKQFPDGFPDKTSWERRQLVSAFVTDHLSAAVMKVVSTWRFADTSLARHVNHHFSFYRRCLHAVYIQEEYNIQYGYPPYLRLYFLFH